MSFFRNLFGGGRSKGFDLDAYLEASMEGLRLQSEVHQETWGFGNEDHWDFSQDEGELIFTFPDRVARAPAQIVGTFDSVAESWMWSWANSAIAEPLTEDARRARELGEQQDIERLVNSSWPGNEMDAWRMAAMTNRLCERNGVYRGPSGNTLVFFTFGELNLSGE